MTTTTPDPNREPGYRGSLPPRDDRLARPWIIIVVGIFVLVIVLSIAGVPSRFIPDPTPIPTPVTTPVPSASPSAGSSAGPSAEASEVAGPSTSASASPSAEAEASPSP